MGSNLDKLRDAHKNGEVLGLKGVAGIKQRVDIDKLLCEEPDTFNLFALALIELQKCKGTDIMGWFQLGGIHGLPKAFWDGVDPGTTKKNPGDTSEAGYCAHGVTTFPTWHRPYLALLEQSLYLKMLDVAESFPDENHKKLYRDAAQKFRLPYWDYHRPRGLKTTFPGIFNGSTTFNYDFSVPKIFTETQIMLKTKDSPDTLQPVDNPFTTFRWNDINGAIPTADWDAYDKVQDRSFKGFSRTQTLRQPKAKNPVQALNDSVNKPREDRAAFAMQMMEDKPFKIYRTFASEGVLGTTYGSLEGIHNQYHGTIGGTQGHMSRVPTAAFDPIFWFHHCEIDRFCAVWQAINTGAWFENDSRVNDKLYPFRVSKADKTFWDSNTARNTGDLGYTYADSVGEPDAILKAFKEHYSWSVRLPGKNYFEDPPTDMEPLPVEEAQVFQYKGGKGIVDILPNPPQALQKATAAIMEPAALTQQVVAAVVDKANPDSKDEQSSQVPEEVHTAAAARTLHELQDSGAAIAATKEIDENEYYREWYVDNEVERLALNGAFTIYYFVGPAPDRGSNEIFAVYPTMAGSTHIFAAPVEVCDNCGDQALLGHVIANTAPITSILRDYILNEDLADLSLPNVKPFLVKNLKWRIVSADGEVIDPRMITSLRLGVSSRLTPRQGGDVIYQEFPEIVEEIIANASSPR